MLYTRLLICACALGLVWGCAKEQGPAVGGGPDVDPNYAPPGEVSADEQALIAKQKVCPVSDVVLGDHGDPIKVMVGDRAVYICCEGCRGPLEKDPEQYLAKLDGAAAASTEAAAPEAAN
jgi:hypothetical protein